jgi:transposase
MKFCLEVAEIFTETFQMSKQAYGEDCLSRTQYYKWYQHFKSGRMYTEDNPRTGRPSTSMDDDHVDKMRAVIPGKGRLTVHEVSEEVGITKSLCHTILSEILEMHRVAAKLVPRLLTDEQDTFQNWKIWEWCINSGRKYF